jgi:hypothetical protein
MREFVLSVLRMMKRCWAVPVMIAAAGLAGGNDARASAEPPWPAPVPGYREPAAGEHPRLLFRKQDVPALRQRAQTPEGQAILKRLRQTLDGRNGDSLPAKFGMNTRPVADGSGPLANAPAGEVFSISHVAGYGFLYQITGEKRYADLGRQAMDKALEGYRGRDQRYSFRQPYGALRAGPALGWTALGYDLCYDGWDEAYRRKIAEIFANYNEGQFCSLQELVRGARHFPASNHWGMQVGGGAMAVLAIMNDPGVDMNKIRPLLEVSQKAMIRNVTEGFGDGGYFAEGDGTGSMASHIIYLSALQAWNVAGGKDFITPRPNARWTALKYVLLTVPQPGRLDNLGSCFPERGGYPHNIWARADGVSGAGYFSIGYRAVTERERAGLWWFYNQWLREHDAKKGTPWDTLSPYPHHSILAFVNTPFGTQPVNPIEVMPWYVHDTQHGFFAFRSRWQDENDIVVSQLTRRTRHRFAHGPDRAMVIQNGGRKLQWGSIPGNANILAVSDSRTAVVGNSETSVAIDFSKASGADAMLVMTGPGAPGDNVVEAGGTRFSFLLLGKAPVPTPKADGNRVVVGGQTVSFDGARIVLANNQRP